MEKENKGHLAVADSGEVQAHTPVKSGLSLPEIEAMCEKLTPVGSRVTCNPPVMDTDADYLALLVEDGFHEFWQNLLDAGFTLDGSEVRADANIVGADDSFQSFSLNGINIIATASVEFYNRFIAASSIAKRLNLLDKSDRIALFQAVLYSTVDGAKP